MYDQKNTIIWNEREKYYRVDDFIFDYCEVTKAIWIWKAYKKSGWKLYSEDDQEEHEGQPLPVKYIGEFVYFCNFISIMLKKA